MPGADFGWPTETLGTDYTRLPWRHAKSYGRHAGSDPPVHAWLPAVAPSSLITLSGFHPAWDNDLLIGTLRDESLYRLRIHDGRVKFAERIPFGARIRDVTQHTDGRLVVWTDDHRLIFLTIAEGAFAAQFAMEAVDDLSWDLRRREAIKSAFVGCLRCHSVNPSDRDGALSLANVCGAPIADSGFVAYSEALKSRRGRWTPDELVQFLLDPEEYAPGTAMPNPGINPNIAEGVADVLCILSKNY